MACRPSIEIVWLAGTHPLPSPTPRGRDRVPTKVLKAIQAERQAVLEDLLEGERVPRRQEFAVISVDPVFVARELVERKKGRAL